MLNLNLTPPAHIKEVYTFSYIEAKNLIKWKKKRRGKCGTQVRLSPTHQLWVEAGERDRSLIDIQIQQQQQVDTRTTKTNPNWFFEKNKERRPALRPSEQIRRCSSTHQSWWWWVFSIVLCDWSGAAGFPWSEASFSTDKKRQIAATAQFQELSANCESQPFSCWLDR